MELNDYLAALRRYWRTWVGVTLVVVALAALTLTLTPPTYKATARVFVSASPTIPNSASFVTQRTKSYPAIAKSQAVLGPVIDTLGLDTSATALRSRITASNPADTSQLEVIVSGSDPAETAAIANAVAKELTDVIEALETPASGERPVRLTLTDLAEPPVAPVAPVPAFLLGLGAVVGLLLGAAAAIVRMRRDSAVYSESDVRRAWGADSAVAVLAPRRGRARRSTLTGSPVRTLASRLEVAAEERPLHVVLLAVAPREEQVTREFADELATELRARGVPAAVSGSGDLEDEAAATARIRLEVAPVATPLQFWRRVATQYDGVVPVIASGLVDAGELREVRNMVRAASLTPLAVVLAPKHRRRHLSVRKDRSARSVEAPAPAAPAETVETVATVAKPAMVTAGRPARSR